MGKNGPFQVIGSFSHRQKWAHFWSSAVFLMDKNGPIQGHQQLVSCATLSPFMVIGTISHEQHWAHPRSLAVILMGRNGPIQAYRQLFVAWLTSSAFLMSNIGPIQGHWQLSSWVGMGLFKLIGSYLWLPAAFLMSNIGPIQGHQQFSSWARWTHSWSSVVFLHGSAWAHSSFSAAFLMSKIGPIHGLRQHFS